MEDKISEVKELGHVYRNTTLTLAASGTKSVYDGFFAKIPSNTSQNGRGNAVKVRLPMKDVRTANLMVAVPDENFFFDLPINLRGGLLRSTCYLGEYSPLAWS